MCTCGAGAYWLLRARSGVGYIRVAAADDPRSARVRPLLQLERELFSCWFRWLTSGFNNGAQRINFEATLDAVERELGEGGGPYFLGDDVTLVDCMFAPFLERMVASLPYYKALPIRRQRRCTLDPHSKWMSRWDMVTTLALLFTAVVTPYEIGFLSEIEPEPQALLVINYVVLLIFVIDLKVRDACQVCGSVDAF